MSKSVLHYLRRKQIQNTKIQSLEQWLQQNHKSNANKCSPCSVFKILQFASPHFD